MYGLTLNGCKQGDFVRHIAEINIIGKALDRLKNLFVPAIPYR